jgi:hypothetical protein
MSEKNYDPDNENCPEKEMVENLHKSKINSENKRAQTVGEFINDSPNSISKEELKDLKEDKK